MNPWTSRNNRLHLFNGIRFRLIRSYGRVSWPWKAPLIWDAFYEACKW